jgi:hypothetical protein
MQPQGASLGDDSHGAAHHDNPELGRGDAAGFELCPPKRKDHQNHPDKVRAARDTSAWWCLDAPPNEKTAACLLPVKVRCKIEWVDEKLELLVLH